MKDALRLIKKYGTRDPFEIADHLGIKIIREDLGEIRGYYNQIFRQKQIHINENLNLHEQLFTCAHELGHAIKHPQSNTHFLKNNTFFSIDKMEIEAHRFAIYLLIADHVIEDYKEFTTAQLARVLGYRERLIELRVEQYYAEHPKKGVSHVPFMGENI